MNPPRGNKTVFPKIKIDSVCLTFTQFLRREEETHMCSHVSKHLQLSVMRMTNFEKSGNSDTVMKYDMNLINTFLY